MILFVSVHPPVRLPSQHLRFEQNFDFLREEGFKTEFAPAMRQDEYDTVYTEGRHPRKARIAARGLARRIPQRRPRSRYHAVWYSARRFSSEQRCSREPPAVVYDFDDAILWRTEGRRRLALLQRPENDLPQFDPVLNWSQGAVRGRGPLACNRRPPRTGTKGLSIAGAAWRTATEVQDLAEFGCSAMPLPDDTWSRGTLLKALQSMALGVPPVRSPGRRQHQDSPGRR
jgi:hypothetical protein